MSIVLNMAYTEALFCAVAVGTHRSARGTLAARRRARAAGRCDEADGVVVIATVVVVGLTTLRRRPGRSESARS